MARTSVTPLELTAAGVAPTPTTIDSTLVTAGVTLPVGGLTHRIVLRVINTAATPKILTIQAGDPYYAHRAALGDIAITVPASSAELEIAGLEASRVVQTAGAVWVDFEAGFTGTLHAALVPWHNV